MINPSFWTVKPVKSWLCGAWMWTSPGYRTNLIGDSSVICFPAHSLLYNSIYFPFPENEMLLENCAVEVCKRKIKIPHYSHEWSFGYATSVIIKLLLVHGVGSELNLEYSMVAFLLTKQKANASSSSTLLVPWNWIDIARCGTQVSYFCSNDTVLHVCGWIGAVPRGIFTISPLNLIFDFLELILKSAFPLLHILNLRFTSISPQRFRSTSNAGPISSLSLFRQENKLLSSLWLVHKIRTWD